MINIDFWFGGYFFLLKYKKFFLNITKETFNYLNLDNQRIIFDCSFVSKQKIKKLNNQLRNKDYVTDVISIAYWDNGIKTPLLGEIFICVKQAKLQSRQYCHSFKREICFLFIHGLLHLLGYDHETKEDEIKMFDIQNKILDKLNIRRGQKNE